MYATSQPIFIDMIILIILGKNTNNEVYHYTNSPSFLLLALSWVRIFFKAAAAVPALNN